MQLSQEVAPGVAWLRTVMVNVVFVEPEPHDGRWVLVDAGLAGHHRVIARAARARFGDRPPAAIILTHAHFDHVGSLERLAESGTCPSTRMRWNCPTSPAAAAIRRPTRPSAVG